MRSGPYQHSRNPTYFAYFVMLVGLFLFRGELSLLLYAAFYAIMIHLWIVRYEEPGLRRRFGRAYVASSSACLAGSPSRVRPRP